MAPLFDGDIPQDKQKEIEQKALEWVRTYRQNWTDRDWTRWEVLQGIDLEAQLLAIKSLLSRNQQAEDDLKREIDDLCEQSRKTAQEVQDSGDYRGPDRAYEAFFEDMANSMAAVGMLAPFVEALFVSVFKHFEEKGTTAPSPGDPRRQVTGRSYWDPNLVYEQSEKRKDRGRVKGIFQIAGSIGLEPFLPKDSQKTLEALFLYRNRMFHDGLEWPEKMRTKFRDMIQKEDWPEEWFPPTSKNGEPLLFSMSTEFIQHCLRTIDGILDGVGAYARSRGSEKNSVPQHSLPPSPVSEKVPLCPPWGRASDKGRCVSFRGCKRKAGPITPKVLSLGGLVRAGRGSPFDESL
ncbi:MAG: hypothetical protein J4F42_12205 [Desulfurellaceae bacterium]|nr:hypothetical protein [Desulfurellaceae bacterium]